MNGVCNPMWPSSGAASKQPPCSIVNNEDVTPTIFVLTEDIKFLSDGWRNIAELNASDNSVLRTYVWGGAGGIGGLLLINSVANGPHFYAYDGNGNVSALVSATNGAASAGYEYDPFGGVLRATGFMANESRFQFSTKRADRTTDLELYEYRVRRTDFGWLSRDPLQESGGINLQQFARNEPTSQTDYLGMCCQVKSLEIILSQWEQRWPFAQPPPRWSVQLHVVFRLRLMQGSDPKDCRITQFMRGLVVENGDKGPKEERYANWTRDDNDGKIKYWWDGAKFRAGKGQWAGLTAVWMDKPGFVFIFRGGYPSFPVYWGGVNRFDFWDFETEVLDASAGLEPRPVAHIFWGMLIWAKDPDSLFKRYYVGRGEILN
jgi:RHS repeat-associated protein